MQDRSSNANSQEVAQGGIDWTPAATVTRTSQNTWDSLTTLGFVEMKRDDRSGQLLVRLTEKGKRVANGHRVI